MKYRIAGCIILLLVPIFGARAQNQLFKDQPFKDQPFKDQPFKDQPFVEPSPGCCAPYQSRIINPPKGVDFKIIIIVPPKDLDPGIVMNPCPELQTSPEKAPEPDNGNGIGQFFKLPPFPSSKPGARAVHFWN